MLSKPLFLQELKQLSSPKHYTGTARSHFKTLYRDAPSICTFLAVTRICKDFRPDPWEKYCTVIPQLSAWLLLHASHPASATHPQCGNVVLLPSISSFVYISPGSQRWPPRSLPVMFTGACLQGNGVRQVPSLINYCLAELCGKRADLPAH